MSWANFLTFTAACTLIVIDVCTEIGNCDRLGRTILFTFFTADTAKLAGSCNCLTFCVGAAGYTCLSCHMVPARSGCTRTFGNTFATGFTCFLIYDRDTIHDMDCIKWTCLYTASEAHDIRNVQLFGPPLPGMKAIISQSSTPVYSYFTVLPYHRFLHILQKQP